MVRCCYQEGCKQTKSFTTTQMVLIRKGSSRFIHCQCAACRFVSTSTIFYGVQWLTCEKENATTDNCKLKCLIINYTCTVCMCNEETHANMYKHIRNNNIITYMCMYTYVCCVQYTALDSISCGHTGTCSNKYGVLRRKVASSPVGLRKLCSVLAALFYSEFPPKYCIMLTLFLHYAQNCFDYAHSVLRNTEQLAISVFLFVIFGTCAICQRDYPALLPDFARDV